MITRLIKKMCTAEEMSPLNSDGKHSIKACKGLHLLPIKSYQPLQWEELEEYFKYNQPIDMNSLNQKKFESAYAVHFINHMSKNHALNKNLRERQLYTHLANLQCPTTYQFAPVSF